MYSKFLSLLAAFFAATLWFGCDDEDRYEGTRCFDDVSIQIVTGTPNDTLYFVPNDSASTTVTIVVTDSYGNARPGQKVGTSLSDPSLGVIEYVDSELQDTTNAQGRVNAIFRSFGIEGQTIISASIGGVTDTDTLYILDSGGPFTVTLETDCDTIFSIPNPPDSCHVCITVLNRDANPVEGVPLIVSSTGGRITLPIPTYTNSEGQCCIVWHSNGDFGSFCIFARGFALPPDSICFFLPS